jgi:hypothetical protein
MKTCFALLVLCLVVPVAARAEGVVTKENVVIEGRILMECSNSVLIENTNLGAITVPNYKIKYLLGKGASIEEAERVIREEERYRRLKEEEARRRPPTPDTKTEIKSGTPPPLKTPPALPVPTPVPAPATPPATPVLPAPVQPKTSIPANEAAAVANCKAYLEAQERYHRKDWDEDKVLEYAQSLKGDLSLFETKAGAADVRLIDQGFADAEGDPAPGAPSKAGYRFKILTAQGANAFGGQKSYIVTDNGRSNMTLGYALVAYPADYPRSGVATFQASIAGVIWKKDLGPQTHELIRQMKEFNPDKSWSVVE